MEKGRPCARLGSSSSKPVTDDLADRDHQQSPTPRLRPARFEDDGYDCMRQEEEEGEEEGGKKGAYDS